MDWYFVNGAEDLVVPKDHELADGLAPPESWSEWGLIASENFVSSNKYFVVDANLPHKELKFNGKSCYDAEFNSSAEVKDPSSCSSICGSQLEDSFNMVPASYPQSDYQLDEFARVEQIDDIFFSSLEDLRESENFRKSFCSSPQSQCERMSADYLLTDSSSDSRSVLSSEQNICSGSMNYLQNHASSTSMNLEEKISAFHAVPCNKNSPMESANGFLTGEISHEESVLKELEMVMAQLSDKTRIHFRDAFYRLAKNSEQNPVVQDQNGNLNRQHFPALTTSEQKMRRRILVFGSGRKETAETDTNIIDRAIANLTFTKIDANISDFPVATPANTKQNVIKRTEQLNPNSSSGQLQIHYNIPQSSANSNFIQSSCLCS